MGQQSRWANYWRADAFFVCTLCLESSLSLYQATSTLSLQLHGDVLPCEDMHKAVCEISKARARGKQVVYIPVQLRLRPEAPCARNDHLVVVRECASVPLQLVYLVLALP